MTRNGYSWRKSPTYLAALLAVATAIALADGIASWCDRVISSF